MGEILSHGEDVAKNMTVNPRRMKTNLGLLKGLLLSESLMIELGKKIGKQSAHEVIYEDVMKSTKEEADFKQILMDDARVSQHLTKTEIDRLLNPEEYVGLAPRMARDVVSLSRKERERD